ncbi:efflux transporter periplasmic adaptor subunit [Pasteurellaceae bacterium 15-036681]|nr:efflux transporter periplasmic adaptor subunit [Pasteurellaceae bacterium 15-036681]
MYFKQIFRLLLCALFLTACQDQQNNNEQTTHSLMKVNVVPVQTIDWARTVSLSGNVVAKEDVAISTALQGLQVLEVKVDVGDWVEKGQVLAVLEQSNVQSQVMQNEANLNRAKANLTAQQATLNEAEATLKRYQQLAKSEAISRMEVDQQKAKTQTAKASVQAVQAEIAQIQAQLTDNKHQRKKAQVVATVSGVVTKRTVEAGALTGSSALFNIAQNGELEIQAEVGADELKLLSVGLNSTIIADNAPLASGQIRLISPEMDSTSRLSKIRIRLNEPLKTAIGRYVQANIQLPVRQVKTSLPFTAISFDNNGKAFAKLVDLQGKVQNRPLEIGAIYQGMIEVLSGVEIGELAVQQAGAFVDEGDIVEPVNTANKGNK